MVIEAPAPRIVSPLSSSLYANAVRVVTETIPPIDNVAATKVDNITTAVWFTFSITQ
jgi:hypothetical protein